MYAGNTIKMPVTVFFPEFEGLCVRGGGGGFQSKISSGTNPFADSFGQPIKSAVHWNS